MGPGYSVSCRSGISAGDGQRFPFPGGPRPRKPGSASAIAGSAPATTSPSLDSPAQAVLGCVENLLVVSAESLIGPQLGNNPLNLGIREQVRQAVSDLGWTWIRSCGKNLSQGSATVIRAGSRPATWICWRPFVSRRSATNPLRVWTVPSGNPGWLASGEHRQVSGIRQSLGNLPA
jgi:hypothetical protein